MLFVHSPLSSSRGCSRRSEQHHGEGQMGACSQGQTQWTSGGLQGNSAPMCLLLFSHGLKANEPFCDLEAPLVSQQAVRAIHMY